MSKNTHHTVERRDFLKMAAATAGITILPAGAVRGATANSTLEIGIIGCGGRGIWVGDLFQRNTNVKVVAVHDYFRDRVQEAGERLKVDPARQYTGLDGYKELLASKLDAVAVESPPYFHPQQTVDALNAGKHVYLAKPIAVDVPGCMAIVDAAKKAQGKLSTLVDFQTRNNEFFRGAAQRVHEGMIGQPVSGQFYYYCGRLGVKKGEPGAETTRLRNWVFDKALSGDIIVEQNIHVLDVANWYLQGHPLKACGTGGRKARVDIGDCWDHFVVTYFYPNDVLVDFSSGQFTYGYDDLCMRLYGAEGTVDSHYGGEVSIRGKKDGWKGGNTGRIYEEGAVNNMRDFCASIMDGKTLNNAEESAHSTMTSILGRMAAYENRTVTWDEMVQANVKLDANLNLPENGPDA
ncbi:MAG TPA: Gfo/Idh/MocA family oxidoreductase [Candidatus Hydrogenedentes bacterium]|nr:Gfo/Idh/MocA family oxidoreductase [Candidatus Hydrogenedentota bacterium]